MQGVLVFQSLWAMERRRPDGAEWMLDEKLRMIRDAGFDGAGVRFERREFVQPVVEFLRGYGRDWEAQCYPKTVEDLKPALDLVLEFGAHHLNLQPDVRPMNVEACLPLLEGWHRLGADAGVAVNVETHRDRMTTDLLFTLGLIDRFPALRLTADLSHYLVGREFAWPIDETNHGYMRRILDQAWALHGRVASREQVQVQISFPTHRDWLDLFLGWWEYGFRSWRRRAGLDDTLTFLCELGPQEYAMTGRDGYELSDRWEEARQLAGLVRERWRTIERAEAPATA